MAGRRWLIVVILAASILHAIAIANSILPAQDGLKFIRIARQFQKDSWPSVVRESDQHPLYPSLVAVAEPVVAFFNGTSPETWRIAAQIVAAIAAVAVLIPLYSLTKTLFSDRIAAIAVAIYALLPVHAEIGHDTLSDSLGLLFTMLSLRWGIAAIQTEKPLPTIAAGLAGGIGYLARPEVILAPGAVALAWVVTSARAHKLKSVISTPALPALALSAMMMVGGYAVVKGQVSEKLALRHGASLGGSLIKARPIAQPLPPGLDHSGLDFSAKEDSERTSVRKPLTAIRWIAREWCDELCWGFGLMVVWGLARQRFIRSVCADDGSTNHGQIARWVLGSYALIYLAVLLRHTMALGYLSGRHTLSLVAISVPWAAAGTFICLRGLGLKLPWSRRAAWMTCGLAAAAVVLTLSVYQLRPNHLSRLSHYEAGQWLAEHGQPADAVLDTRGWARFVSGLRGYDYWHVRQALTDSHLSYVVVGLDELAAGSERAKTLNAVLAFAADPIQEFRSPADDPDEGVRIYRFRSPESWKGIAP